MKYTIRTFPVPHDILEDTKFKKASPLARIVYVYLAKLSNHLANDAGWFWRSIETLCIDIDISKSSLLRALKNLQLLGLIEVKRGISEHKHHRSPNFYRINGFRFRKYS